MAAAGNAAPSLAGRLRELRKSQWPGLPVTQAQLAEALRQRKPTSVQLVSLWEQGKALPSDDRLYAIATFYCTRRSFHNRRFRLLDEGALDERETAGRAALLDELRALRRGPTGGDTAGWPWTFSGSDKIVIVCAELPRRLRAPGGDQDPDRSRLIDLADLDSAFELAKHISAVNPGAEVVIRGASQMTDDWAENVVLLGGIDWNGATKEAIRISSGPVRQHSDDDDEARGYFYLDEDRSATFAPTVVDGVLVEDVGHLARERNPKNQATAMVICNGMFGAGVYGAARALTDSRFRSRNAEVLRRLVVDGDAGFSLLFRVLVTNGVANSPEWDREENILHFWSG